jgi:uncharacterized protein
LWVVKDADTTIYLFGTVHVLKPGLSWFDEAVKDAFDKSDTLVLEMVAPDEAAQQAAVIPLAYSPDNASVTESLPADKRAAYGKALADVGIPPAAYDKFDPWLSVIALSIAPLIKQGYDPNSGAEKVLTEAAKAAGKPIEGLETFAQQLGYFDGMPRALQLKFLVQTIDQLPELGPTLDRMVKYWAAGDPDKVAAAMNEDVDALPEVKKLLLTDRNQHWADWIHARLDKPGTVFVAVGTGHLAGADSVQADLAKQGIKAARIPY